MMKNKNLEHCCKDMDYFLKEKKVLIFYNPIFRGYFTGLKSYKDGKFPLYYCPWCGKKFLPSLVDEYVNLLVDEYDIEFDFPTDEYFDISSNDLDFPRKAKFLPKEFESDEWWKKRGL